jgi:cation transport regulator ChaB
MQGVMMVENALRLSWKAVKTIMLRNDDGEWVNDAV